MALGCQTLRSYTEFNAIHQNYMNTQTLEIFSKINIVIQEGGVGVSLTIHFTYFAYTIIQIIIKKITAL